jgi:UDP-N-acetylglucosamine 1-carboxyvinyltransferase
MERLRVIGGRKLYGKTRVATSKNAVLPILACCLAISGEVLLKDCPRLSDVDAMLDIIRATGGKAEWNDNDVIVDCSTSAPVDVGEELTGNIRSSVFVIGPLLTRFSCATVSYPGGCDIGLRPIDLHIAGLEKLGARTLNEGRKISLDGKDMINTTVFLDFPSVGATENLIMASLLKSGTTVIHNPAREPEIVDLANFVNVAGGKVFGAGGNVIVVEGVKKLHGCEYYPMSDRIVAGTFMIATAITGGETFIENADVRRLGSLIDVLTRCGAGITATTGGVRVRAKKRLKAIGKIETQPYPGFPTDLQAQVVALEAYCNGCSVMIENLFESRFKYVSELIKTGADITVKDRVAVVRGKRFLSGANMEARDLRGGAALVLGALGAKGESNITGLKHIDRGYDRLENSLVALGADVVRIKE